MKHIFKDNFVVDLYSLNPMHLNIAHYTHIRMPMECDFRNLMGVTSPTYERCIHHLKTRHEHENM